MSDPAWQQVDDFLASFTLREDEVFEAASAFGMPAIDVSPLQGKLLHLLARMCGARRILEFGTLAGYSTIWLARALPDDGELISLEYQPAYAENARRNLEAAGVADRVDVRVGAALETVRDVQGPFDLVFIDADKANQGHYLEWALRLARPGTVIVGDNVVRDGSVAAGAGDASDTGIRDFFARLAAEPRLSATAIQTVGAKGWDGFALALVD